MKKHRGMSVESTNQIWFPWTKCRDGYEIRDDEAGEPWFHPVSANEEQIVPLTSSEPEILFQRFAGLNENDPLAILAFITDNGLSAAGLEPDPLELWQAEIERMRGGVKAWQRRDFDGLTIRFNELNMSGLVHLRLEPQPGFSPPILYLEPTNLFQACWTQFAHAVSHDETQRQCDHCHRWYRPQTQRSRYCEDKCRFAAAYKEKRS